jgi:hypothetical protein
MTAGFVLAEGSNNGNHWIRTSIHKHYFANNEGVMLSAF